MMLPRMSDSPPPMYTTSGFEGQMPTEPIDDMVILPSVIGFQVVPPSVLFHAPPPVAPNQYSFGLASLPSAAIERPPRAGPTLRQRMPPYKSGSTVPPADAAGCCADVAGCCA